MPCLPYSWGRACHFCERRNLDTCTLMQYPMFEDFMRSRWTDVLKGAFPLLYISSIPTIPPEIPFGRDKYPYQDLLEHVPEAFQYLRRHYHNRVRRQMKDKINSILDKDELILLYSRLRYSGYRKGLSDYVKWRLFILFNVQDFVQPAIAECVPRSLPFMLVYRLLYSAIKDWQIC